MLCIILLGDEMNLLLSTVMKEKQRIEYMLSKYRNELLQIPKGSLSVKSVNGKEYFYLKYRENNKVCSKYIRQAEVETVRIQIEKRKHIEAMIRSLEEELAIANKVLE